MKKSTNVILIILIIAGLSTLASGDPEVIPGGLIMAGGAFFYRRHLHKGGKPIAFTEKKELNLKSNAMTITEKELPDTFVMSKKVNLDRKDFIAVDDINKQFVIARKKQTLYYNYKDLLDFVVSDDTQTIISGKMLPTAVGGIALGAPGALLGAVGKRKIKKKTSNYFIKLTLRDLNNPLYTIQLPANAAVESKILDDVVGTLAYILHTKE